MNEWEFYFRPGNVDIYGLNFTLRHPQNLWKAQNDIFETLVLKPKCIWPKCIGPKYFWAKVFLGQGRHHVKVLLGSKYSLDRNVLRAKVCLESK